MIDYIIIAILIILLILISNGWKINFYYVLLIAVFVFAINSERQDFFDKNGTRLRKHIINGNETKDSAFLKLLYSSEYAKDLILWRQCYIISLISAFLVWIVLTKKIPDGQNLFITTLVIFIVTYLITSFYIVHLHNEVQERVKNNISYYNKFYHHL